MSAPDIIFFGGTFDPPHDGHNGCVRLALERFPEANVLIVPAMKPASIFDAGKEPKSDYETRVTLCKLAFSEISTRIEISRIEEKLPVPNYSVMTIRALEKKFPSKSLGILIGMDQFENFGAWREAYEILSKVSLVVVGRNTQGSKEQDETSFIKAHEKLKSGSPDLGAAFKNIFFLQGQICPASSTEIRLKIKNGQKLTSNWLSPKVETFIKEHRLYLTEEKK
jgi:nicotinate-nucleotide adenylyltransferase